MTPSPGRKMPRPTGLCANCCRGGDCSVARDRPLPVIRCEEYAMDKPSRPAAHRREAVGFAAPLQVGWNPKGLCMDCQLRGNCSLVRQEGGVWRCEEYR